MKEGARECLGVVIKLLLFGSVCGLVCIQRKEGCEVKRRRNVMTCGCSHSLINFLFYYIYMGRWFISYLRVLPEMLLL